MVLGKHEVERFAKVRRGLVQSISDSIQSISDSTLWNPGRSGKINVIRKLSQLLHREQLVYSWTMFSVLLQICI